MTLWDDHPYIEAWSADRKRVMYLDVPVNPDRLVDDFDLPATEAGLPMRDVPATSLGE